MYDGGYMGVGPTSLSSIAPGWKGGKLPPLGGSLGEYSLNDFDEQPAEKREAERGDARRDLDSGNLAKLASVLAGWMEGSSGRLI